MKEDLFDKIEKKTKVGKDIIIKLARELQEGDFKNEDTLRNIIGEISTITGKEVSKENTKKENIKKSLSSRNNAKLNKVYCYSHKLLNPSRLKIQKDDLNSNKTMNKFHFKNAFNDIYNWEIKLIKPNNTVKQSLKRQKATNNILQDLEDYNLIQFNMKQLLKRDAKHKDKFILNTRRNSVAKRKSINDEVTNNNISYKDKNKLTSSRKGSTMNNFKTIKLNEYYNLTYS